MEDGGSSVYLLSEAGVPLASTQGELTPLQRNVMILGMNKKAEMEQEAVNNASGGQSPGPIKNSLAGGGAKGGGGGSSRTFVNTGPDGFEDS